MLQLLKISGLNFKKLSGDTFLLETQDSYKTLGAGHWESIAVFRLVVHRSYFEHFLVGVDLREE